MPLCDVFTFLTQGTNELNRRLERQVLLSRSIYLVCGKFTSGINSKLGVGEPELLFLRFVICSYMTTLEDVLFAFDTISKAADLVLAS
ncbi:unnamed protein product [Protopolystoma xenopodis]|uniref:Aminotransferase class V domain-containing protein n=1 Tax=Protopolystoma xenopodis TaxID=117903 RepID=A0A448WVE5_9PLAT|nr:unnamed protein product [Protopolystoma xenopodis]